jgi:hypothetical protein
MLLVHNSISYHTAGCEKALHDCSRVALDTCPTATVDAALQEALADAAEHDMVSDEEECDMA